MKEEEGKTDEAATLVQEVQARIRDSLRLWQEGGGQTGPVELRFFWFMCLELRSGPEA